MSTRTTYGVNGMTCGHCVSAVAEEIDRLPGIHEVVVDLVTGGTSEVHVTSESPPDGAQVRAAVEEAGYELGRRGVMNTALTCCGHGL